jgi:hypothetical protein
MDFLTSPTITTQCLFVIFHFFIALPIHLCYSPFPDNFHSRQKNHTRMQMHGGRKIIFMTWMSKWNYSTPFTHLRVVIFIMLFLLQFVHTHILPLNGIHSVNVHSQFAYISIFIILYAVTPLRQNTAIGMRTNN